MTESKRIKIRIQGPGINVERYADEEVARDVLSLILGGTPSSRGSDTSERRKSGDQTSHGTSGSAGDTPALREFLNEHGPKRNPEKIATIAEYLKVYKDIAAVTKQSLARAFEEAAEAVPGNLSRDITWTLQVGWIAPKQGEKDTYYLTSTGSQAVRAKFPAEIRKKTKVSMGGRRRKRASKGKDQTRTSPGS